MRWNLLKLVYLKAVNYNENARLYHVVFRVRKFSEF